MLVAVLYTMKEMLKSKFWRYLLFYVWSYYTVYYVLLGEHRFIIEKENFDINLAHVKDNCLETSVLFISSLYKCMKWSACIANLLCLEILNLLYMPYFSVYFIFLGNRDYVLNISSSSISHYISISKPLSNLMELLTTRFSSF